MQKHRVSITIVADVYAETEEDLVDTVRNSFEGPVPHLIGPEVADIGILSGPIVVGTINASIT